MNTVTLTSLREEFLLDPSIIYLNHGSFGATPRPGFESYQRWQRELENQPCLYFRKVHELLEHSRTILANFLGTTCTNLAYVTNATTGINIVAHSMKLKPGDEVLSTDHEYGALDRTWQFLSKKQGFKYVNQPIPLPVASSEDVIGELWKGVTNRTRIIFLSHVTSPTALIFPIQEICKKAREQGIMTVIDGAHAPGQVPLNLDEIGADFYSGNLHKWLCAPKGTGFLFARQEVQHLIEPLVVSWGWMDPYSGSTPLIDFVEQQGTRDLSSFLAVPDAIQFFNDHNWDLVRENCYHLLHDTILEISDRFGLMPSSTLTRDWISQMGCAPIPEHVDCAELHCRLYDEYSIEIPVSNWKSHKALRISIQGYNSIADTQALIDALKVLI